MNRLTDVLILGGGIVGCAIADEAARRGARVTLADPRGISKGATHASAGMASPHLARGDVLFWHGDAF